MIAEKRFATKGFVLARCRCSADPCLVRVCGLLLRLPPAFLNSSYSSSRRHSRRPADNAGLRYRVAMKPVPRGDTSAG